MSAAASFVLGVHLATLHLGGQGLEPVNPGLYVRTEQGLTAGAFRNSYDRLSTYAGWTWTADNGRFALTAGAVTGYPVAKVMPLLVPSVRLGAVAGVDVRLSYLPRPLKGATSSSGGLHLSIERGF